ncbi:MAG: sensory rhodopsin transducer [Lentisphaeria bacterium]|nr:sensory rhodopsin transducer [Lentisphaeria bacterium]
MEGGKKVWYFADGYLPEKGGAGPMEAHEALMLFNTGAEATDVKIDIYFSDRPPADEIAVQVCAERVLTLRMDHPADLGGTEIPPLTQYALRIRSSRPVVAQFGRLDTTQSDMAYYVGVGYCE